jgi:hypothetical protein
MCLSGEVSHDEWHTTLGETMKINLQNRTHWRDDQIRAFLNRAMRDERPDLCKRGAPALTVVVVYKRNRGGSSGCAYLNSNWITVRLPKWGTPNRLDFAFVITHELAHTRGVAHRAMSRLSHYWRSGSYLTKYAWGNDLPLEVKQGKVTQRRTVTMKLTNARKRLKAALTREKRAVTLRKKWQQKVKYYGKRTELAEAA